MKKLLALSVLSLGIAAAHAIPLYEPFNYLSGVNLVGQVSPEFNTWVSAGSGADPQPKTLAGNLSYAGLPTSMGGSINLVSGIGSGARFPIGSLTSGTIYFSFLMQITDTNGLSTAGVFWGGLNNGVAASATLPTVVGTRLYTKLVEGGYVMGVAKNDSTVANWVFDTTPRTTSDVLFIVGSYQIGTGSTSDDVSTLYINPDSGTFGAASPPATGAILTAAVGTDITASAVASFVLMSRIGSQPAAITIDELRLGTSWAEVTGSPYPADTLVRYDPSGGSSAVAPASLPALAVNANVVATGLTRGSGLVAATAGGAFNSSSWHEGGTLAEALAANNYLTFTVAPAANYTMALSNLRSSVSRSANGPPAAALLYSADGFGSSLASSAAVTSNNGTPDLFNVSLSNSGLTSPLEFRWLAWTNSAVVTESNSTFRIGTAYHTLLQGIPTLRSAGTLTWDGGGTNDDWGSYDALAANQSNWDLNKIPTTALVDSLVFEGNTRLNPNNNIAGLTVNQVTFGPTAGAFTLSGNGFTLNSGIVQNSPEEERMATPLTLGASQTWQAAAGALLLTVVDLGAATLTVAGDHVVDVSGTVSGTGGLTKTGAGQLWLHGANTYAGGTIVSAGTLVVANSAGSGTGSGAVTVDAGATLKGGGRIAGNLSVAGTVAPGLSVGTLTVDGSLALSGALALELNSSTPGADKIVANGLTLNAGAQLTRADLGNASLSPGTTFTIIDNTSGDAVSGTFTGLPEAATFALGLNTYRISYTGGTGNDVTLTALSTPVAGADALGAVANHSAGVGAAKLLANDSDPGGSPVGLSSVSAGSMQGGTVSLSAGVVTYTPPASFTGADQFTYTITNNIGVSGTGTVMVTVRPDNAPSSNQISVTPTQNGALVRFAGIPGRVYGIERSVDSMTWNPLGNATAQERGLIEFEDNNPPQGVVHYRTVVP